MWSQENTRSSTSRVLIKSPCRAPGRVESSPRTWSAALEDLETVAPPLTSLLLQTRPVEIEPRRSVEIDCTAGPLLLPN